MMVIEVLDAYLASNLRATLLKIVRITIAVYKS